MAVSIKFVVLIVGVLIVRTLLFGEVGVEALGC